MRAEQGNWAQSNSAKRARRETQELTLRKRRPAQSKALGPPNAPQRSRSVCLPTVAIGAQPNRRFFARNDQWRHVIAAPEAAEAARGALVSTGSALASTAAGARTSSRSRAGRSSRGSASCTAAAISSRAATRSAASSAAPARGTASALRQGHSAPCRQECGDQNGCRSHGISSFSPSRFRVVRRTREVHDGSGK